MAPRVNICAGHQSNLVLELLADKGKKCKKNLKNDSLKIGKYEFKSRFILGSGKYSLELIKSAIEEAKAEIITLALRRANTGEIANILDYIPKNITLLPNTSGARNADEALRIARLSRELGCGELIKIEVIGDSKYLLPDNYETIKACELLAKEGFTLCLICMLIFTQLELCVMQELQLSCL